MGSGNRAHTSKVRLEEKSNKSSLSRKLTDAINMGHIVTYDGIIG